MKKYLQAIETMQPSECLVTHMTQRTLLSTSESRREAVIRSAIAVFAASGYLGTPIADVAKHAKISAAYVFKLFPSKEELISSYCRGCSATS
jgi:AcrR family transcriptional regulator